MYWQVHVAFNRPWATSRQKVVSVGLVHKDEGRLEHVLEEFNVMRCEVAMHTVYLCTDLNELSTERRNENCYLLACDVE